MRFVQSLWWCLRARLGPPAAVFRAFFEEVRFGFEPSEVLTDTAPEAMLEAVYGQMYPALAPAALRPAAVLALEASVCRQLSSACLEVATAAPHVWHTPLPGWPAATEAALNTVGLTLPPPRCWQPPALPMPAAVLAPDNGAQTLAVMDTVGHPLHTLQTVTLLVDKPLVEDVARVRALYLRWPPCPPARLGQPQRYLDALRLAAPEAKEILLLRVYLGIPACGFVQFHVDRAGYLCAFPAPEAGFTTDAHDWVLGLALDPSTGTRRRVMTLLS